MDELIDRPPLTIDLHNKDLLNKQKHTYKLSNTNVNASINKHQDTTTNTTTSLSSKLSK
jgi:hypothetical protein